jgi:transposase
MSKQAPKISIQPRVEGKRRRYTPQQKRALLDEAARPGGSISATARKHGISPSLLFNWKRAMDDAADKSLQANEPVVTESEVKDMRKRIRELERMLGRQTMRAEILEEALDIAGVKKPKLPGASSGFKGGR